MRITEKNVQHVATLANLEVTDAEAHDYAANMSSILEYVEKLNELDTSSVEPMAQVLSEAAEGSSLRADADKASLPIELSLSNAPEAGAGHFKAPKEIGRAHV